MDVLTFISDQTMYLLSVALPDANSKQIQLLLLSSVGLVIVLMMFAIMWSMFSEKPAPREDVAVDADTPVKAKKSAKAKKAGKTVKAIKKPAKEAVKTAPKKAASKKATAKKVVTKKKAEPKIAPPIGVKDDALTDDALADNALADNALADNALADNALADNALADNALADNALADNALADNALAEAIKDTNSPALDATVDGFSFFKRESTGTKADAELISIEQEMLAIRQLYMDERITKDVYVVETRRLYEKASELRSA